MTANSVVMAVWAEAPLFAVEAAAIAQRLKLPLITEAINPKQFSGADFLLVFGANGLALLQTGKQAPGAVQVDFVSGAANHRRLYGGGKSQLIAKAVGLHTGAKPTLVDATAGLGRDGFVLACLGCRVTLIERSPIIAELLADGIRRANLDELVTIVERICLVNDDSIAYLTTLTAEQRPEVIYLDPMFPARDKTAKVKKEMALFHDIVGFDRDENELLTVALQTARCRVVVKRSKAAAPIAGTEPTYQLIGKSSRYDIYALSKLSSR